MNKAKETLAVATVTPGDSGPCNCEQCQINRSVIGQAVYAPALKTTDYLKGMTANSLLIARFGGN